MNINLSNQIKNINKKLTMKLKIYRIIAIVVVTLFIGGGITSQAQGIFNADNGQKADTEQTESTPGIFKDGGFGDGVEGPGSGPGGDDQREPIGGGLVVLSLLTGAYALIKRKVSRKHEN